MSRMFGQVIHLDWKVSIVRERSQQPGPYEYDDDDDVYAAALSCLGRRATDAD